MIRTLFQVLRTKYTPKWVHETQDSTSYTDLTLMVVEEACCTLPARSRFGAVVAVLDETLTPSLSYS